MAKSGDKKRGASSGPAVRKGKKRGSGGSPGTPRVVPDAAHHDLAPGPSPGAAQQQTDVYGDLFNLGPTTTYGADDPAGLFHNPMLYFDDSCPVPTSSWDVMPTMSHQVGAGQPADLAGVGPSNRCSTPVSNYSRGVSAGAEDALGSVGALPPGPYDYYGLAQPGYNPASPPQMMMGGPGGPSPGGPPQAADSYAPMGSYGQGQYHGRMRYAHQQPSAGPPAYGMPYHPGQHHHPLAGYSAASGAPQHHQQMPGGHDHRALSHYGASTVPPGAMSSAMSSSRRGGQRDAAAKMESGLVVGKTKNGGAPGGASSRAAGSAMEEGKATKRKTMASAGGAEMKASGAQGGAYMQPVMGIAMHGPPGPGSYYQAQAQQQAGAYPLGPPALGHHGGLSGPGKHQQDPAAGGPYISDVHGRKYPAGLSSAQPVGSQKDHSIYELGDRELSSYVRPMVGQLQQIIGMLDANTKMNISESLLRLAAAKEQGGVAGGNEGMAAGLPQTAEEKYQNVMDRNVCQLLYNNSRNGHQA